MNIDEALCRASSLNHEIKKILKELKFDQFEDLSGLEFDKNAEHALIRDELRTAFSHLDDFRRTINYLNLGVIEQGILELNSIGRYQIAETGKEYTCGSTIEFLYDDDFDEQSKWCVSRIEATEGRYYIVGFKSLQLEGLKVRVRRQPGIFEY